MDYPENVLPSNGFLYLFLNDLKPIISYFKVIQLNF